MVGVWGVPLRRCLAELSHLPALTGLPGLGEGHSCPKGLPIQVVPFHSHSPFLWLRTAHPLCEGHSKSCFLQCIVRETEARRGSRWGSMCPIREEYPCALFPSSSSHHQETRQILGELGERRGRVILHLLCSVSSTFPAIVHLLASSQGPWFMIPIDEKKEAQRGQMSCPESHSGR